MNGLKSRATAIIAGCAVIVVFLGYAFWPRAIPVDIAEAKTGPMVVTINEEAKTRVHDAFVVSAPIAGRLLRIEVDPGDTVTRGETVIARMLPTNPTVLDVRTEEQAKAAIEAAEAALVLARAEVKRARADADFANLEATRTRKLRTEGFVAELALDRAERAHRAASAALETALAAVDMRVADLENARALLMTFSEADANAIDSNPQERESIPILAPASGNILRVIQESETIMGAGAPILEIGNPQEDLEIVAELLSSDAVKIKPGDRVIIDEWGGETSLTGEVERIEPWGFTKFSALGVEEQRVNVIIGFTGDRAAHARLGHGFRVEVNIVTWERDDALAIPASALFRTEEGWAVFHVDNGHARTRAVEVGQNNGVNAAITDGLADGDLIVLYPSNQIVDGVRVKQRTLG